jgi:hypothetical protein
MPDSEPLDEPTANAWLDSGDADKLRKAFAYFRSHPIDAALTGDALRVQQEADAILKAREGSSKHEW